MSGVPHITILHTIAERLGARVEACQEYDPNVCRFRIDAEHGWVSVAVSGYALSHSTRLVHKVEG